jgi:hypothetical protein
LARDVERELAELLRCSTSRAHTFNARDLPHEPSAFAPARDPPQVELAWDDQA